jgi:hypothetical protein
MQNKDIFYKRKRSYGFSGKMKLKIKVHKLNTVIKKILNIYEL